jgi:3-hydroxyisobutyrate dehydrogenase-like beta-hydroxyacid dehydrogenase
MSGRRVGILHPGQMGSAVAATIQSGGNEVLWASEGRSRPTRERASELGLLDVSTLTRLCEACSAIVSVCPPEFADDVADQVISSSFRGLYVDANAISPERVRHMDRRMRGSGIAFVDGSIIGLATRSPGSTWIYFSGENAAEAASCFGPGPLQAEVIEGDIGGGIGKASALKMCFAAYSKGTGALLCAVLAAAEQLGVRDHLERQWTRPSDGSPLDASRTIARVASKAWRFAPEMREIASTFESAGITPDFHRAAAGIYSSLAAFKDSGKTDLREILRALTPVLTREEE